MLQIELLQNQGVVIITPDRRLTESDFSRLSHPLDDPPQASSAKMSKLMICAKSFPGWEGVGAFCSHVRFVTGHQQRIERVAIVTDSGFLKFLPRIARYVVSPEIRQFAFSERD